MSRRAASWLAALVVAAAAFLYGAVAEGPPSTNADRVRDLSEDFACPVCAGQSIAESDVPVAREIRRQIAVWVDEGRSDAYIRDELVAAYDADIDYNPSGSGVTSLVWILPLFAGAGIATVVVVMLRPGRARARDSGELPTAGRRRWRNAAVWTVAVVVVAGAAGLLVARSSGSRTADGSITGEIRSTAREKIFEAQQRLSDGDMAGAIAAYDEALELQPSNVEALTYRGWLTSRQGDLAGAAPYLDDAVAMDPAYPDARLFRAIVALEEGDGAGAAQDLAAFDSLDPPPYAEQLLTQSRVRERVAEARDAAALEAVDALAALEERPAFGDTALSVADALAASEALASRGDLLEAVQLLDWVLESRPADPDVLSGRGWLLVRSGDAELFALGVHYLDAALGNDPSNASGLVYRAFARWLHGDTPGAQADLAAFDALPHQPPDLVRLIEDQGLRTALN
ncbi:MAG: tetratricopeptide repeat protein [Acidimicrobiaceae bacterium]|nr:tetratricopeptide repeat protein [Acidimicrobiaceae bacterium]MYL03326.1 tetratricopeptide repeat protein [Acidimicrobiaceae bacterium]